MSLRIPLAKPDVRDQDRQAVSDALASTHLSRGPMLERFEQGIMAATDAPWAVAVSSGTGALHLSLMALGISSGDEVITTAFSVPASVNPILALGARPVFIDIDPSTRALDPQRIAAAITSKTRAVLAVHPFGQAAAIQAIVEVCENHRLLLIEDTCEALGTRVDGQALGRFGQVGCFGFYPNKQITCGEGGAIITADEALATRLRQAANNGRAMDGRWLDQDIHGLNYRLAETNAALGASQLARLDEIIARRTAIATAYAERLGGNSAFNLPTTPAHVRPVSWFAYVIELDEPVAHLRDRLVTAMHAHGIGLGRYFAPLHRQPALRAFADTGLENTDRLSDRALALPLFHQISDGEIDEVCTRLTDLLIGV